MLRDGAEPVPVRCRDVVRVDGDAVPGGLSVGDVVVVTGLSGEIPGHDIADGFGAGGGPGSIVAHDPDGDTTVSVEFAAPGWVEVTYHCSLVNILVRRVSLAG